MCFLRSIPSLLTSQVTTWAHAHVGLWHRLNYCVSVLCTLPMIIVECTLLLNMDVGSKSRCSLVIHNKSNSVAAKVLEPREFLTNNTLWNSGVLASMQSKGIVGQSRMTIGSAKVCLHFVPTARSGLATSQIYYFWESFSNNLQQFLTCTHKLWYVKHRKSCFWPCVCVWFLQAAIAWLLRFIFNTFRKPSLGLGYGALLTTVPIASRIYYGSQICTV